MGWKEDNEDNERGMVTGVFEADVQPTALHAAWGARQSFSGTQAVTEWEIDSQTECGIWSSMGAVQTSWSSVMHKKTPRFYKALSVLHSERSGLALPPSGQQILAASKHSLF